MLNSWYDVLLLNAVMVFTTGVTRYTPLCIFSSFDIFPRLLIIKTYLKNMWQASVLHYGQWWCSTWNHPVAAFYVTSHLFSLRAYLEGVEGSWVYSSVRQGQYILVRRLSLALSPLTAPHQSVSWLILKLCFPQKNFRMSVEKRGLRISDF